MTGRRWRWTLLISWYRLKRTFSASCRWTARHGRPAGELAPWIPKSLRTEGRKSPLVTIPSRRVVDEVRRPVEALGWALLAGSSQRSTGVRSVPVLPNIVEGEGETR